MSTELGNKIIALRAKNLSYRQITEELGCSSASVAYWCSEGNRVAAKTYGRDRRSAARKFIQEVKQASPCVDCGENYPYWMMDFDHLEDKKFNISRSSSKTVQQLKEEIAKCELVCANCHRTRTHLRQTKHGSDTMDISASYGR
jgi:transposase